ncbi:MAG: Ig-like domain repeat protein [Nocardioidaceae bacterium]|nr:Ig-like domain repeat protein [Nocardioidaceae bacterium]MCL2612859.1 Ig-like domain repeat protein [Nocardioidaceae bacterium]
MRKLIAAIAATAVPLGLSVALVAPADASITSPGSGATVHGTVTFSDSGVSDGTACLNGTSPNVAFSLINSAGTAVWSQTITATGAVTTGSVVTESYPNGTYTLRAVETSRKAAFLALYCTNSSATVNNTIKIDNVANIVLDSPASAPQNTTVPVSATLTDPNASPQALSGQSVTFALSGGGSVTATTNGSGVASANLPIAGPPRSATVTASFAGSTNHDAKSASSSITVAKDATSTTVVQPADVVHGQATSFTANVAATQGGGVPTGTVQFTVDGSSFGSPVSLAGGSATSGSTSTLYTGAHTVGAVYSGDSDYTGGTAGTKTQQVGKAATTTTLGDDPTSTVSGQAVTFTATVGVQAPGAGTPTGSVQFDVDGQPYGTAVPLDGDHASVTISNLHAGNRDVDATYNGDGDFASSSSATLTHGVNRDDTSIDLSTSVATPLSGQPVTYSAHVTADAPGGGTPTGTVQFSVDGSPVGDPVAIDSSGNATSSSTQLLVGTHHVTADYSGDGDFAGGSDALDQTVDAAHTTTTLTTSPNPSVFGQSVTLHAEVAADAPATGHPGGAIKFTVDGNTVGTFVDLDHGVAETTVDGLAPGPHTMRATYYSDDENFVTSSSDDVTQTVDKAATSTSVTSSSAPSVFGQPVTFTAEVDVVSPGAGDPTGTVTFSDGSTVLGSAHVDSSTGERATITVSDLSVATHAVTASYAGDDDFTSSSGSVTQTVQRAQTSTVVTSSANPAQSGQGVKFTATVTPVAPGAGDPSGTVTFTVNGAPLGQPVAVVGGTATSSSFASLSPGTYAIAASYSGDRDFVASDGTLDQGNGQSVSKGATTLALSSDGSPSAYGSPVTFTAKVTAGAPATGHPSGVVQFWEGATLLGATGLSDAGDDAASTTFVSSTLKPGDHTVTATYVGNFNFDGSTASVVQTVRGVPTVTGVSASADPITYGDSVTFTATVAGTLPTSDDSSGTVTFTEGDTVLGTAQLATVDGHREASLKVDAWEAGDHRVTASYDGGGEFGASTSAPFTETVQRAATSLSAATLVTVHDASIDAEVGIVKATLTGPDGSPLAGRTVSFTTHQIGGDRPVCSAVTDAHGVATCTSSVLMTVNVMVSNGYDAAFAGDTDYLPSTDHGSQY